MNRDRYVSLAAIALIFAICIAQPDTFPSLPWYLRGLMIGLGAAIAVRLTVVAATTPVRAKSDRVGTGR